MRRWSTLALLAMLAASACAPRGVPPRPVPEPDPPPADTIVVPADTLEPPAIPPAPPAAPAPREEVRRPPPQPRAQPLPPLKRADQEARVLWITRFDYRTASGIALIMEKAHRAGFNIVYFQVRGTADAFYRSGIEPCAVSLCGALGGSPSFDPLDVAVREAHARGLQIHAWVNALAGFAANTPAACGMLRDSPPGRPMHILRRNPEFAMVGRDGRRMPCPNGEEYIWLSPAYAEVRTQLARVSADIARRYRVDGIHLDRIRFPDAAWSHDPRSLALFGRSPSSDPQGWSEFRRMLINLTVRETFDSITAVRPSLALSAAVWGVYDDRWQWRASRGVAQYAQDPLAWAIDGYLDVAAPMTYFRVAERYCAYADWACLLDDHLERIQKVARRHLYIGVDASKGAEEIRRQVLLARERGAMGIAVYSYGQVERAGAWPVLRELFARPAEVPPMPWKSNAAREVSGQ